MIGKKLKKVEKIFMKIKILESTLEDIRKGWYFYESQKEGLENYFMENIISDIDSLKIFAGIH